jgi:hypothetical protein
MAVLTRKRQLFESASAVAADPPKSGKKGKSKDAQSMLLREDVAYQKSEPFQITEDRGIGILENVKILGWKSRNKNRRYDPKGINPELYEGIKVYLDHPDVEDQKKPRSFRDSFGWMEGVYKTDDGLYAKKFKFDLSDSMAKKFITFATHRPDQIGFSQNAFGDVLESDDGEYVQAVTDVRSIDLVTDPATTKGLFEAKGQGHEKSSGSGGGQGTFHKDTHDENIEKHAHHVIMDDEDSEDEDTYPTGAASTRSTGKSTGEDVDEGPPASTTHDDEGGKSTGKSTGKEGPDITPEMMAAAGKIVAGPGDLKTKAKRLIALLKVHHIDEGYKPQSIDEAKDYLHAQAGMCPSMKLVLESLDTMQLEKTTREQTALAKKICKEMNLPRSAMSTYFMRRLTECKTDVEMREMIEDRLMHASALPPSESRSSAGDPIVLVEGNTGKNWKEPQKVSEEEREKRFKDFDAKVFG